MAQNLNLTSITTVQGISVFGTPTDNTGWSVSGIGDVNNDGYDDVIIGAPITNSDEGESYVIYGGISLVNINLANLNLTQGFSISDSTQAKSGWAVSGAGNINGDNYEDFIIGAPNSNYAYVIYGGISLVNINLASLNAAQGFSILGPSNGDIGYSVSGAGDTNNDGYDDVIIGAPSYDSQTGLSYVIYGGISLGNINLANLNSDQGFSISGATAGDYSGYSVSGAGDINGDEYEDFIIGAPYANNEEGLSYIIYGGISLGNINLASLNTAQGFSISGATAGDYSGWSVSGAGDINNDGYADVIIGAQAANNFAGISYVIYGRISLGNINLSNLNVTQGFSISGTYSENSGWSVREAGDVNGDGYIDIIIGAQGANDQSGESYVIYGGVSLGNINLANLNATQGFSISGPSASNSGYSVSGAGDINNDGYDDVIIGAPTIGEAYVIYGSAIGFITLSPTSRPSSLPTQIPTTQPSSQPSTKPSLAPSSVPSFVPSSYPSVKPTNYPSLEPTSVPSSIPTDFPTTEPSVQPTSNPSIEPSSIPTSIPSIYPSAKPTSYPSSEPTSEPSSIPTNFPSSEPSGQPSAQPFADPTSYPTSLPTSKPSRAYELVLNYNVQTAIFSTLASLSGGIILYLAPSYILKNWGYKYKYVYNKIDKESLQPHEIGIFKKDDKLTALHKENNIITEYLLEVNSRKINGISLELYELISEQLDSNPSFKRNPANSKYKYIYNDAEVNYLKENEIGLKVTGKLLLLSCDIFCNSEQLTAFKLIGGEIREFPIKITSHANNGISKALFHSIASEYTELASSVLISFEENQIRDFLLIREKMKPSISVFQKIFCLYTPIYKDLGNAPGLIHNALNCNGYGPEFLYRLITLDGLIPGFIYGLCYNFLKKYQVGLNSRISDDSFKDITIYIDNHLKSEVSSQTITNPINQEKKDDLERGKIGSDIDSSSFEQASSSVDMFDRIKKPTSTCVIQAVYEIEFDNPIINEVYQNGLGLSALKPLAFSKEETDVRQITQLGNSESYKSDKSSFNEPDMNYPNHIIGTFINARQVIEYIPIMKYVSQNIIYPLIENHLPESAKNISLPEILDSKVFLFTAHLSLGSIGAMLLPQETINKGLIASTAASTAYGIRLASSNYLAAQKQEVFSNNKPMDAFEITKYCVSTILSYTVPALAICALAKMIMPSYQCSELDLGTKLSFAEAECYSVYKATQIPTFSTTADIVIPYITDAIVAAASYANGYGPMAIVASVVTADWMSRLAMDMVTDEIKENYVDHTLDYILKTYSCVYETINHIIGITQEF